MEEGVWQTILKRKYIGTKTLSQVVWKPVDSHFWAGLMSAKESFFRFGKFAIKDGSQIRFWEDIWLGHTTLMDQYPALYNIVRHREGTLASVMQSSPSNMTFRRDLTGTRLDVWNTLLGRLAAINLDPGLDIFRWNLLQNGKFSVDSMYKALIQSDMPVDNNKKLWKMKMPLKTKKIAWYARRGVILTKDNLVKRNWHESTKCVFCLHDETIKHLFFDCKVARSIWSTIQVDSNLYPPRSVVNIFGNWLHGIDDKFRTVIRMGVIAVL